MELVARSALRIRNREQNKPIICDGHVAGAVACLDWTVELLRGTNAVPDSAGSVQGSAAWCNVASGLGSDGGV